MNSSCDLSYLTLIAVSGEKTADFLQGQLTCDMRDVNAHQTRRAAHCSRKGRILSTFRVLQFQENFYLLTPLVMSDLVITQLKKYAIFSKVTFMQDDTFKVIGCIGNEIAERLENLFGTLPEKTDQALPYTENEKDMMLVRIQGDLPRFEIIGNSASIFWLQKMLSAKYPIKPPEFWRLSDIQSGIATIYPKTCDLFTPQMLNYPALNAVSFKKGCYVGQEIIARTHYLGKEKKHLHTLRLENRNLPNLGDAINNKTQQIVGTVVDAMFEVSNQSQLLVVLQDEAVSEKLYWEDQPLY